MSTPRIEEYLEAIYKLQEKTGRPVNISRVAESMGLSVPSASEMIKKLSQSGAVAYNQQREVSLTETGLKEASAVVRRHRLSERFLTDLLGMSWDEVHEEACLLEHALTPAVEDHLAKKLGNPTTCPHGHPIPDAQGHIADRRLVGLADLAVGNKALVSEVENEDPEVLKYLASLGLLPGTPIEIKQIAPFGGPITVLINDTDRAIGPELAGKIMVEPLV